MTGQGWSRGPETYQSIENPIQSDRIENRAPLGIETAAPKRTGSFGIRAVIFFWFMPLIWSVFYCYIIAPVRRTTLVTLAESVYITLGIFLFVSSYPSARRFISRHPITIIGIVLLLPLFVVFDSIAFRICITFGLSFLVANLFSDQMLQIATALPVNQDDRNTIRSYWSRRFSTASSQVRGVELHWVTATIAILLPIFLIYIPFPISFEMPGGHFLSIGMLTLFVTPWLVEKLSGLLYGRKSVSFYRMIKGFSAATYEWMTYEVVSDAAPGVVKSKAGSLWQRRRLSHAVFYLLMLATVPMCVIAPQLQEAVSSKAKDNVASVPFNGIESSAASEPSNQQQLQPFQQDMLDRMSPENRQAYLRKLDNTPTQGEVESTEPPAIYRYVWGRRIADYGLAIWGTVVFAAPWVFPIFSPFLFFFGYCFALTSRIAGHYPVRQAGQSFADSLDSKRWNEIVQDIAECDELSPSVFLGLNACDNSPIIVPRKIYQEHAHFLGDTGSGKTSMGLTPLMAQLIRQKDCSIVVVDLKGDDLAMFHGVRTEAANANLPFKWFSNQLGAATHVFNPLQQAHFSKLSLYQRTDVITGSLGLQYGTDYGRSYFSDANSQILYHCFLNNPDIQNFSELSDMLDNKSNFRGVNSQLLRDGSHLQAIIARLASFEPLNATPKNVDNSVFDAAIDMGDAFKTPGVYYFYLSAALGTTSSAEMARLALYSLLSAAKAAAQPRKQVFLFIDEFQRITAKNLELFLQTARSFNIGVILANQTMNDLKTADVDLATTVKANCRLKQHFSVSDPTEIHEISKGSGETVVHTKSYLLARDILRFATGNIVADSTSYSEQVIPRIGINQILLAGDHPNQSIFQIRRGEGYAQFGGFPFILRSCHHIPLDEYHQLRQSQWPLESDQTITPILKIEKPEFSHSGKRLFESPLLEPTNPQPKNPEKKSGKQND